MAECEAYPRVILHETSVLARPGETFHPRLDCIVPVALHTSRHPCASIASRDDGREETVRRVRPHAIQGLAKLEEIRTGAGPDPRRGTPVDLHGLRSPPPPKSLAIWCVEPGAG